MTAPSTARYRLRLLARMAADKESFAVQRGVEHLSAQAAALRWAVKNLAPEHGMDVDDLLGDAADRQDALNARRAGVAAAKNGADPAHMQPLLLLVAEADVNRLASLAAGGSLTTLAHRLLLGAIDAAERERVAS